MGNCKVLCIPQDWDTSCQNFWPSTSTGPCQKKINHDHTDTLKKRTKTTVTPSVFGQQPSWWHRHVAAIAAHSAIPHIVVTTPPFESCSLPSAKKIVYFQRQTRGPPVITGHISPSSTHCLSVNPFFLLLWILSYTGLLWNMATMSRARVIVVQARRPQLM